MCEKVNKVKMKVEFKCDAYKQTECGYFSQDKECKTTKCAFGLYERDCVNKEAIQEKAAKVIFEVYIYN